MDYAPNVRFCELVLNGEYLGLYLMVESVTNGEGRLRLSLNVKNAEATGYLLRPACMPALPVSAVPRCQ